MGRRLMEATGLPLGRPRCEARMTLALWRSAYSMVGRVSRMRGVVEDRALGRERDVEVNADEDALVGEIEVANGELRHDGIRILDRVATGLRLTSHPCSATPASNFAHWEPRSPHGWCTNRCGRGEESRSPAGMTNKLTVVSVPPAHVMRPRGWDTQTFVRVIETRRE